MLLSVEDLGVRLPGAPRPALEGVSLGVEAGEVLCVVGASGAGKSTLAQAVLRLLPPGSTVTGAVRFRGESVLDAAPSRLRAIRGGGIGIAFQETGSALDPLRTIGSQVREVMRTHGAEGSAEEALARAGMPEPSVRAREYPHQLSGGLRQRAMLAMAIAARPAVLIADEPTSALDAIVQAEVLASLAALRKNERLAILLITHDLGVVAALADRVVVLAAGRVVEEGTTSAIFGAPAHPETAALLAARLVMP